MERISSAIGPLVLNLGDAGTVACWLDIDLTPGLTKGVQEFWR